MMKKLVILFAAMLFIFTAIGCGSSTTSGSADQTGQQQQEQQQQQQQQQNTNGSAEQQSSSNTDQQKQTGADSNSAATGNEKSNTGTTSQTKQPAARGEKSKKNPIVTIVMEDGQKITVELYPSIAPNTVRNFVSLVKKGFYNGLIFHRVIPGFMIQGGDPSGDGSGGPGYSIKGEFSSNGFANDLKHTRGVISMARTSVPDSAGSQFFIMVNDTPSLDGQYAAFGKVLSGMDEVDKIVSVERDAADKPLTAQKMKKVTVDTFGVNYGDPVKVLQ